ncbi:MAG: DNA-binding protein [Halobacteria archaeon]
MADDELEAIRRKKMEQLAAQQHAAQAQAVQQQAAQQEFEAQKASILRQILTPEARERLNSLKMARPDFGARVELQLISLAQSGQIRTAITDEQLRVILERLSPQKRDIKIRRL